MNYNLYGIVLIIGGAWLTAYAKNRRRPLPLANSALGSTAALNKAHPQLSQKLANAGWEWVL